MAKIVRKKFFDGYREAFDPTLDQQQVDALEFLVTSFEGDPKWKDVRQVAYAFATIFHETAATMRPITEYGSVKYFDKYDSGRLADRLGNTPEKDGDGFKYRGRGYVQITGQDNYEKFGIADSPDDALKPETAFQILSVGMQVGSFTTKKISTYIKGSKCDYLNARKVINGLDKASLIAGYARSFEKILRAASSSAAVPAANPQPAADTPAADPPNLPGIEQPPITSEHPPPVETVVTRTEDGVTVEASKTNQQDVNQPAQVAQPEPYLGIGFWKVIKRDFTAATGGNLSLAGLSEYAQQASGWPPWIVGIISKIAVGVLIATFGYLAFRVIHYAIDTWKKNQKVKVEVDAKTATDRKDIEWV
jgi:putative chitinase